MSIWTRIAEAVAAVGNSVAAYFSGWTRRRPPERSIAFTIGMIALSAKMAKADGVVTGHEIEAFRKVFVVDPSELGHVARVFNLAKQDVVGFEVYARQIARLFKDKRAFLENVLDGLFVIAKADGVVHERELAFLMTVSEIFSFTAADFARVRARHVLTGGRDHFTVLGVEPAASDEEIKKAYRKLARDNHPDKQIAAGMPPEAVRIATERLARINAAYDAIMKERAA
jgi:DnaJ like chaperone protein